MSIDKSDQNYGKVNNELYDVLKDIKQSLLCIENKIDSEFIKVNNRIDSIEKQINNNNLVCEKMSSHINFVEDTYDNLKRPLFFLKNQVEKVIGRENKEIENEQQKQITGK